MKAGLPPGPPSPAMPGLGGRWARARATSRACPGKTGRPCRPQGSARGPLPPLGPRGPRRDCWLPPHCPLVTVSQPLFPPVSPDLGISTKYLTSLWSSKSSRDPHPLRAPTVPTPPALPFPLSPPRAPPHAVPTPHDSASPAAVQPHVPAAQPGAVVLVLVGGEVPDDGRLPGLQRVGVLVGAVPATRRGGPGSVRGSRTEPLLGCERPSARVPPRLCRDAAPSLPGCGWEPSEPEAERRAFLSRAQPPTGDRRSLLLLSQHLGGAARPGRLKLRAKFSVPDPARHAATGRGGRCQPPRNRGRP